MDNWAIGKIRYWKEPPRYVHQKWRNEKGYKKREIAELKVGRKSKQLRNGQNKQAKRRREKNIVGNGKYWKGEKEEREKGKKEMTDKYNSEKPSCLLQVLPMIWQNIDMPYYWTSQQSLVS